MPAENRYFVYLMTNWNHRVMYVGVTNDLERRLYEHRNKLVKGFTEKYNVSKLVYFEETNDVQSALAREKEIKKWRREKKDALVIGVNSEWKDLSEEGKDFSLRRNDTERRRQAAGGRRYAPYAFTEQGVAMLSTVLNSERAIQVNIEIMRVFVRLRQMLSSNAHLVRKLDRAGEEIRCPIQGGGF